MKKMINNINHYLKDKLFLKWEIEQNQVKQKKNLHHLLNNRIKKIKFKNLYYIIVKFYYFKEDTMNV